MEEQGPVEILAWPVESFHDRVLTVSNMTRSPMNWRRIIAREWLWLLGTVVFVIVGTLAVLGQATGGEWMGQAGPPNTASLFAHLFLIGYLRWWILGLYATVALIRFTIWAIKAVMQTA